MCRPTNNSALRTKTPIFSTFYILLIISTIFSVIAYTSYTDNKTNIPIYLNFIGLCYLAAFVKRIRLFLEELFYLKTRYKNNVFVLIKEVFYFNYLSVVFFLFFVFLLHYFVEDKWSTFISSNLSPVTVVNVCWLCLIDEFLKLDECSVSTSIKLNDFLGLDYGSGMASSFFHGYLKIMLPYTGDENRSFLEFLELYQAQHKVTFDVKKLFILLPRSCECFPSLQVPQFPNIEEAKPLDEIERDVAGVKKRIYKNSVYKIRKPNQEKVYVSVEYATPLRTFKEVISHNSKYSKIYEKYKDDIVVNFYKALRDILEENPQCDSLCELIYYDDKKTDGSYVNVGNLILKRIKDIRGTLKKKKD